MKNSEPDPYAPPAAAEPGSSSTGSATTLQIPVEASIPAVCLKCGTHSDVVHRPQTFSWTPQGATGRMMLGGALFGALGGLAAAATDPNTRRITLDVPLCPSCFDRRSRARLLVVGAVILLVAAFVLIPMGAVPPAWGKAGILFFLIVPTLSLLGAVVAFGRTDLHMVHASADHLTLGRVNAAARDHVLAHLDQASRQPAPTRRKRRPRAT